MADIDSQPVHKFFWLPNALTVMRIILIPFLLWSIIGSARGTVAPPMDTALGIFIICMITDFLDGYFARKWKITSDFGRMLDPIADKLLIAACLIAICITFTGAWFYVAPSLAIIGRDISVSGIREHAANSNIILSPTKLAKWKTAFEMLAILVLIVGLMPGPAQLDGLTLYIGNGLLWFAAILSVYTGVHYFRSALRKTA